MKNHLPFTLRPIDAVVTLPGSKSLCNRTLLIAAMAQGRSVLSNMLFSDDVIACLEALRQLGYDLTVDQDARVVEIEGSGGAFPNQQASIYCHEAGTLTRFILPICAAQSQGEYYVHASERMMARPIAPVFHALEKLGAKVTYHQAKYQLPATINAGGLNPEGEMMVMPSNESSQFLSAMLLASPLIEGGLRIQSETTHAQPYVDMTVKLMDKFGVKVSKQDKIYITDPRQHYIGRSYVIEPDISTASYFWAVAALTQGRVKVKHTDYDTMQGDIQFLKVLEQMGCQVEPEADGIVVVGAAKLKGVDINMRTFSDTFMTVVALACFAETPTRITGLAHTRLQESDRVEAMRQGLTTLGVTVETTEDSIYIDPLNSKLRAGTVSGFNDHRIAMSLSLLGIKQQGVVVDGSQCVAKTCPDYFERMQKLLAC